MNKIVIKVYVHPFKIKHLPHSHSCQITYLTQFIEVIVTISLYNINLPVFSKSKNRLFFE